MDGEVAVHCVGDRVPERRSGWEILLRSLKGTGVPGQTFEAEGTEVTWLGESHLKIQPAEG